MFKIKGADQKEYGPVTADVIRQWVAERRIDGRTLIQADGAGDWKPLAEFPEFAAALAGVPRPPSPVPGSPQTAPSSPPKTSSMAIASLVCGVLGCLGITALIGLILGIVSLVKISRSEGRLKGSGLAIGGICCSMATLVMTLFFSALMLPAVSKGRNRAQSINCMSNLKQLALGARMYASEEKNQDRFPAAANWSDSVTAQLNGPRVANVFVCKSAPGPRSGYAMNQAIAGKKTGDANPDTVLFFESDAGWNASGGLELALKRARHGEVNVAFADGHVEKVTVSRLPSLRWDP